MLHDSQVQVNHLYRRILAMPADTPLVILHTPVVFGGWGCPQIATRAALNFVQGSLSAIDSRSSLAQTVLREQATCPMPLRQGDYEQFAACCTEDGVVIRTVSELAQGSTPPVLRATLLQAEALYVTTDVPDGPLQPEFAGVGIVVTDGTECQEFSFGVVAAAVSSSALEWLAKLLAMLLLQHCRGELYMFCDNASLQVSAHSTIVTTQSWVDRLARKVLQLPVFSKVRECWLPAQHDTHDQGQAARWQAQSDALATFAKSHPSAVPLPWSLLLSCEADVLIPFFQDRCVFHRARFLSALYSVAVASASPMADMVRRLDINTDHWVAVCESHQITLQQHRQAAYLRSIAYLPLMYFDTPPCRFCHLESGNEGSHLDDCSQLYVRAFATFAQVAETFTASVRGNQQAQWDLHVRVMVSHSEYWCMLVPDSRVHFFQHVASRHSEAQVLILTWSGMSWVKYKHRTDHRYISAAVVRSLVSQVLSGTERGQDSVPGVRWPLKVPDGQHSPYSPLSVAPAEVPLLAQQILAWLLRWDPRLRYTHTRPMHVFLPIHNGSHGPLMYHVTACTPFCCHRQVRPQLQRLVVVCTCLGQAPEQWNVVQAGVGWTVFADSRYSTAPLADY